MDDMSKLATNDVEQAGWTAAARRGAAVSAIMLGLLALTACGGPSLNSPEGVQQEQDMQEEEEENRRQ
jgi:hypothetical protein